MAREMNSPAREEYLELLYRLEADGDGVRPSVIAHHLGISTAAVAEMLANLERDGSISRGADRSVHLSESGRSIGRSMLRRHRLIEQLLHRILARPIDVVHEEACVLEHAVNDEITESLARTLGEPDSCPHGNPIPRQSERSVSLPEDLVPLSALHPGQSATVFNVAEEDSNQLKYLLSLGLLPGVEVVVEQAAPLGGPLLVRVGEARYALGRDVAHAIGVRMSISSTGAKAVFVPRAVRASKSLRPAAERA